MIAGDAGIEDQRHVGDADGRDAGGEQAAARPVAGTSPGKHQDRRRHLDDVGEDLRRGHQPRAGMLLQLRFDHEHPGDDEQRRRHDETVEQQTPGLLRDNWDSSTNDVMAPTGHSRRTNSVAAGWVA